MDDSRFEKALEKGALAKRLTSEEAFELATAVTPDRLHALGQAALANRLSRFGRRATFVFNLQINPANICGAGCSFCDYAASANDPHAYVLSEEDIFSKVKALCPTEVHIVGGLNQVWPYERNLELVRQLRGTYPNLHIKAFTAVEIAYFAQTAQKSPERIIQELIEAGINAMTGGGAEIFSRRLYEKHWKNKIGSEMWLSIHRLAHGLGIPTNATMLFGFGETWRERVEHMLTLRKAQDVSKGFACFIPLAFQPGKENFETLGPTPLETLAVMAIARMVLDNIVHLKSYWPMTGIETAAAGLSWGGDDMDGTIMEEKIAHMAGAATPKGMARTKMTETILMGGFTPVERDGLFKEVSTL